MEHDRDHDAADEEGQERYLRHEDLLQFVADRNDDGHNETVLHRIDKIAPALAVKADMIDDDRSYKIGDQS